MRITGVLTNTVSVAIALAISSHIPSPFLSHIPSSLVALPHSRRQFAIPSTFLSLAALHVFRRPSSPIALLLSPPATLASHRDRVPNALPSPSVPPFVNYYLPSRCSSSLPSPPVDPSIPCPRSLPSLSVALILSPPFSLPLFSLIPFGRPRSPPSLSAALVTSPPF
ncbi:unnamed protein product [Closterium sp. NIES-64]|nr:unnamed protein product [Closterium sp. NIES-64]